MSKKIPRYLVELITNVKILAFVTLFAFLFVIVYSPFQATQWFLGGRYSSATIFFIEGLIILGGIVILGISRFFMWLVNRKNLISMLQYCFWLVGEIIIIGTVYTIIDYTALNDNQREFITIFQRALIFVPMMLFIPYTVSYLFFALKDRDKKIEELLEETSSEPLATYDESPAESEKKNAPTANTATPSTKTGDNGIVNIFDEKGTLKLSIRKDYVFYIESADNYVNIFYEKNGKMTHSMVRTTLKSLEEALHSQGFMRCHRSYLINVKKIKIVRKERDGFYIDLDQDGIGDIPISKTYADEILKIFA